jgi:aminopeptidase N
LALLLGGHATADEAFESAPPTPFAIEHIALDLDVDLPARSVSGTEVLDVKAVRDLAAIKLDAVGLEVASVTLPAKANQSLAFSSAGESLEIVLPLKRDESARLKIAYAVRDPKAGLHFFGPSKREPDVPLEVYSQGEARMNRYWFACVDNPCVKQTTEVTAHVPAGFECLSNGSLAEKADEDGGKKTRFHWVQSKPHSAYLVTLVVGKFHVAKEEWHGKPVLFYVPEKHRDDVERSFGTTKAMLEFFSKKIGVEYAWDKYAQVIVEQFGWGGMENTSATTLNQRTLHDERAHLDFDSDGLVSHELAHQWWGDLLTCHDWAHIWLNEGFASYFEALWDEERNGSVEFEYNMFEKSGGARDDSCKKRPVVDHRYNDPESVFDSRAYPKGAWVLHGLRRRVGDDAFWRSIHRYCVENSYKNVETVDLRRAFEAETGESLERYFYDLTERPGHPAIDASFEWREEEKLLEATIKQTQPGEAYAFKTTIGLGDKATEPTRIPVTFTDEKEKRVLIPLAKRPRWVRFDPDEAVLKDLVEHKGEDQWLVQLTDDANPVGRIRAAQALAETRSPRAMEAVVKALLEDRFHGVSIQCAQALKKAGGDAARDGLIRALAHANPKVRRAAADALASFHRDEKVIAALRVVLEKGDPSYYVEASAVSAYGQTKADDARAWLEKALAKPSHNEVIREQAIYGLASLEDPALLPVFEKLATEPGGDYSVRRAAIGSWGRVAALPQVTDDTRQKVVKGLVKLVQEEGIRLRWSAVDALGALGKEALTALATLDGVIAHDGEGRVRDAAKRAAERIRANTPPDKELTRLREEMQRLRESEEKLRDRVEKIEAKESKPSPEAPPVAPVPPAPPVKPAEAPKPTEPRQPD